MELRIDISRPDALALLALLETSNTFPDVVEELRAVLDLRVDGRAAVAGEEEP